MIVSVLNHVRCNQLFYEDWNERSEFQTIPEAQKTMLPKKGSKIGGISRTVNIYGNDVDAIVITGNHEAATDCFVRTEMTDQSLKPFIQWLRKLCSPKRTRNTAYKYPKKTVVIDDVIVS